jgi:hypothetical protein
VFICLPEVVMLLLEVSSFRQVQNIIVYWELLSNTANELHFFSCFITLLLILTIWKLCTEGLVLVSGPFAVFCLS